MKIAFHQYSPTKHQMELIHRASLKALLDRGEITKDAFARESAAIDQEFKQSHLDWLLDHIRLGVERFNSGSASIHGTTVIQLEAERNWFIDDRPFYNVYPILIPLIESTKLDAHHASDLDFPSEVICMCFPIGDEPHGVRSLLARRIHDSIALVVQTSFVPAVEQREAGVVDAVDKRFVGMFNFTFQCSHGENPPALEHDVCRLRDSIDNPTGGTVQGDYTQAERARLVEALEFSVRAALILALLADGSDLITPLILKEDESRTDASNPADWAIQRAIRRGRKGFALGRSLQEIAEHDSRSPHYRKPHLALYHVGKGRQEKKLILRDGCIVVPRELTEVPTDYLGPETSDDVAPSPPPQSGYRPQVPNRVRYLVLERDAYKCVMCGRMAKDGVTLEVDHVIAVSKGGRNDITNLQTLCNLCNSGKSNLPSGFTRS